MFVAFADAHYEVSPLRSAIDSMAGSPPVVWAAKFSVLDRGGVRAAGRATVYDEPGQSAKRQAGDALVGLDVAAAAGADHLGAGSGGGGGVLSQSRASR